MNAFADPATLYFFFDFISHNAWLAWDESRKLAQRFGLAFEPVPVVFGALLKAHGQLGPAEIPPKIRWMTANVLRKARALNLPLAPPHSHPFNPLAALRLACCELAPEARLRLIERLWRATWAEGREVASAEALGVILTESGFSADELLAQAAGERVKNRLRANTDTAIADGVFGVPTIIARGELFWGFDDLPHLQSFLEGRDALAAEPELLEPWRRVRPSVQRTR